MRLVTGDFEHFDGADLQHARHLAEHCLDEMHRFQSLRSAQPPVAIRGTISLEGERIQEEMARRVVEGAWSS